MFFFSIIPIPLIGANKKGSGNEINSIEAKIKDLESFITAKDLGQDFDADYSKAGIQTISEIYYKGNNEITIDFAQKELEKARQEDLKLRSTTGLTTSDNSPIDRLSEIYNHLAVAEQRIRDLQNLDQALKEHKDYDADPNTPGIQMVSGLNTMQNPNGAKDARVVEAELQKAINYQNDLKSAADFWGKVGSAHENIISKSITEVTKDEMENNVTGIKRLEQLHDLLNSLIKYNAPSNIPGTQTVPGLNTAQNPNGSKDANVVRQALAEAMFHFETRIEKAKGESWYPELKAEMQKRLAKIETERKNAEEEATTLEKQLNNLPYNAITANVNAMTQQLYRRRALVGGLTHESQFLNGILNPQNTGHSTEATTTPSNTSKPNGIEKPNTVPTTLTKPMTSTTGSSQATISSFKHIYNELVSSWNSMLSILKGNNWDPHKMAIVREQIKKAQSQLEKLASESKGKPWAKQALNTIKTLHKRMNTQKDQAMRSVKSMEAKFRSTPGFNPNNTNDPNSQKLYKAKVLVGAYMGASKVLDRFLLLFKA